MNQTELLLANARDDIDRRLIEFGHDPSVVTWFKSLSPAARLLYVEQWAGISLRRRRELGLDASL